MPAELKKLAEYTQGLTGVADGVVIIGRDNFNISSSGNDRIFVDRLGPATTISSPYSFNGTTEKETYSLKKRASFTLTFTGPNAETNKKKFQVLQRSQTALDLQRDLKITVYHATNETNLRTLFGSTYKNQYEIELNMGYTESESIDTLRIDTAVTSIITD